MSTGAPGQCRVTSTIPDAASTRESTAAVLPAGSAAALPAHGPMPPQGPPCGGAASASAVAAMPVAIFAVRRAPTITPRSRRPARRRHYRRLLGSTGNAPNAACCRVSRGHVGLEGAGGRPLDPRGGVTLKPQRAAEEALAERDPFNELADQVLGAKHRVDADARPDQHEEQIAGKIEDEQPDG